MMLQSFFVLVIIADGWDGGKMAREFAKDFYNSRAWRELRKMYIRYRVSVDGGMCEVCKEKLGYIVHHKIWLTQENIDNPEIALNTDNLRYECIDCHNREEKEQTNKKQKQRYVFNSLGELVVLPPDQKKSGWLE